MTGPAAQHDDFRQGRHPDAQPSGGRPLHLHLTNQDEADITLNDLEADKYGPLTEEQLKRERKLSTFDPSRPRRPVRVLPVGKAEDDTEDFRRFRSSAMEHDYPVKFIENNPKVKGTASHKRYDRYCQARTLSEVVELSMNGKTEKERREQRARALKDITNDALRGYILFPEHEHASLTHYVNAAEVARECGTVNFMALYSEEELVVEEERAKAMVLGAIETRMSDLKVREGVALLANAESFMERREAHVLRTFHEQIESLWEFEKMITLSDGERKKELMAAAGLVEELMVDEIPTPATYKQAISATNPDRDAWLASMAKERKTLEERGTWKMVPITQLKGQRPIGSKYVFKVKLNKDKSVQRKSRLVAQGFIQVAGTDFSVDELYAGVCSYSSMRFLLSLATQKGYYLSQSDISGAYLESYIEEDLYMRAPPDCFVNGKPPVNAQGVEMVSKLRRGLYGLKQSGFLWSQCFRNFLCSTNGKSSDLTEEEEVEDIGNGHVDLEKMKCDNDYAMGFKTMTGEPSLFRKRFKLNGRVEEVILGCYVDDLLIATSSMEAREWFLKRLSHRFPVNPNSTGIIDKDHPGLILSMDVHYDREAGILRLDQKQAIEALARKHGLDDPKKVRRLPIKDDQDLPKLEEAEVSQTEYLSVIGSCLHIAQVSRPDINYAIGVLSRHSAKPGHVHMAAAQDLVCYLYGSRDYQIEYKRQAKGGNEPIVFEKGEAVPRTLEQRLKASTPDENIPGNPLLFVDADYAGCKVTRRSTSGMVIMMNGGPITWSSRLQKITAQSSAESEIYAVCEAVKEAIHIRLLCEETGIRELNKPMAVYEDNAACIALGHSLKSSKSAKHYQVRLRFLQEHVRDGTIEFEKVDTKEQLADGFTKALPREPFESFRGRMLVRPAN